MPRYYFDVDSERPDTAGVELPDRKAARSEAIRAAAEILRDIDGSLSSREWVMQVKDESGAVILELRFVVSEPGSR
jgi:hypothetical protein